MSADHKGLKTLATRLRRSVLRKREGRNDKTQKLSCSNSSSHLGDSKSIAFVSSDSKLRVINVGARQVTEIDSSRYGNISTPAWSPDSKWLAYSKQDASRTNDIYFRCIRRRQAGAQGHV